MNLRPGIRIGPFTLAREIARGGQGAVFEARDPSGGVVALKLLLDDDGESRARFLREAETLARLEHPGLVRAHSLGQAPGGVAYLALELVRGQSLADWVRGVGLPPLEEVTRVMRAAAEALHYCHEQGLVHRDLKPQNLLLEAGTGRVVVVDFGLVQRSKLALAWKTQDRASLTQEGTILGTPAYMPPEQISAEFGSVDRRADVYGLGATLFFLLTGEAPFKAPGVLQVLSLVVSTSAPDPRTHRPNLPPALSALCLGTLAKDPDERPSTALEFAGALDSSVAPARARVPLLVALLVLVPIVVFGLVLAARANQQSANEPDPPASPPGASAAPPTRPLASEDSLREALARAERLLKGNADQQRAAELLLSDLAAKGSSEAALRLGTWGGEAKDPLRAAHWFQVAAEAGSARAMANLGLLYEQGLGVPKDFAQARSWYRRGAEQGIPEAMSRLGVLLLYGRGGSKDEAQAVKWLEAAVAGGDPSAHMILGHCARQGRGVPRDLSRAAKLYEGAVDRGLVQALVHLSTLYSTGSGVPRDPQRALELLERGAKQGDTTALFYYGEAHFLGEGTPKDYAKALEWFMKASEKGDTAATTRIGLIYLVGGPDLPADPARGVTWLERGANRGAPAAMFLLGKALLQGRGTESNPRRAASWLKRAAMRGDADAMLLYAELLRKGRGVPQDQEASLKWLEQAAKTGHARAQGLWGAELRQTDPAEAIKLLNAAANKGDQGSMYVLGVCYTQGEGVARSAADAKKWFKRAIARAPNSRIGQLAAQGLSSIGEAEPADQSR